jgi:DamX protein
MVENDKLTHQIKNNSQNQAKASDLSLITQERTRKLDLLVHLLVNLNQALIVCGPDGIGKTTLLKALQERNVGNWLYCLVQGDAELSFEKISQQLIQLIAERERLKSGGSLSVALGQFEQQHKKVVLMIDDAGALVPGLITTLANYAVSYPALSLIFVLTHDDLYVKNTTDRVIEDCHLVELPPLTEKQCGVFLQYLAAKPGASLSFNSITDGFVETIYRETHGIPGRIIADLPGLNSAKQEHNPTKMLLMAVSVLVLIAMGLQWYSASRHAEPKNTSLNEAKQKPSADTLASSESKLALALTSDQLLLSERFANTKEGRLFSEQKPLADFSAPETQAAIENHGSNSAISKADDEWLESEKMTANQPKSEQDLLPAKVKDRNQDQAKPATDKPEATRQNVLNAAEHGAIAEDDIIESGQALPQDGGSWITSQPAENFTLQVMVLTREQAINELIKKYSALSPSLNYLITTSPSGKKKFLLLYGSYASAELANKAKNTLPPEFRQAYPRKFSSLKN